MRLVLNARKKNEGEQLMSNLKGFISTLIAEKPEYELDIYRSALSQNPVATPGFSRK
jgi:hypothetical protein